jgi:hypothetical protein
MTLYILKLLQIREVKWKCFLFSKKPVSDRYKNSIKQFYQHYESQ